MGRCDACIHYRMAKPPNPLSGIRLLSAKTIELQTKWQQDLASRALLEQQRMEAGIAFDFEPWAYPYCAHFSDLESSTAGRGIWTLCAVANPNDDCAVFTPRIGS